jgi:hypothetical protein
MGRSLWEARKGDGRRGEEEEMREEERRVDVDMERMGGSEGGIELPHSKIHARLLCLDLDGYPSAESDESFIQRELWRLATAGAKCVLVLPTCT